MRRSLLIALMAAASLAAAEPVRVIFDTDMGNDVDDALALAVLHALQSRGECRVLAVTITKDNRWSAPFIDLVNTFYGRGDIPIGIVKDGKTKKDGNYTKDVVEKKTSAGRPLYARRTGPDDPAQDAVVLLRSTLAAQPDHSVVVVQVGFSTNLARLLRSGPDDHSPLSGRELASRKVRLLSAMAGRFPPDKTEYNVVTDVPSAQEVFSEWPGPVVTSGWEIGDSILFPVSHLAADFGYTDNHPIADAYRAYRQMPYREPLWDPTAALYAVRPDRGYFTLSPGGRIHVDAAGRTLFEAAPGGNRHYLIVDDAQRASIREAIELLASQPPGR